LIFSLYITRDMAPNLSKERTVGGRTSARRKGPTRTPVGY